MILTCPTCSTRFSIPAKRLLPEGRNVKCSNCSEIWFALPDPDELLDQIEKNVDQIPESVRPIPEGSSVPVIREEKDEGTSGNKSAVIKGMLAALLVLFATGALLFAFKNKVVALWPPSAAIFELAGHTVLPPGAGVEFDRIMISLDPAGEMHIEGYLINLKSADQSLPQIEAVVRDSQGEIIAQWNFPPPANTIGKEATLAFSTTQVNIPAHAESVHLSFALGAQASSSNVEQEEQPPATPHDDAPHPTDSHEEESHEQAPHPEEEAQDSQH